MDAFPQYMKKKGNRARDVDLFAIHFEDMYRNNRRKEDSRVNTILLLPQQCDDVTLRLKLAM